MEQSFDAGLFSRIVLQPDIVGVYVFVFENDDSRHPERDYHQDDIKMAKLFCLEEYGTAASSWKLYDGDPI
ncbi:hypothetical protein [Pontixanthobacter sp. CEM42]|uniref:hypothetical protein n=1 Tax=Pontixanthobacter sp. CEM42 TaxID=2792077 RepID=UPI001ADFA66B|nr:hypothetical protein [Pontixanthobacter sp. CEM42]